MKNKNVFRIVLFLLAVILAGAFVLYTDLGQKFLPDQLAVSEPPAEEETTQEEASAQAELPLAPDFTVYDADGKEVHLLDYLGKPIVLNFWAIPIRPIICLISMSCLRSMQTRRTESFGRKRRRLPESILKRRVIR